MKVALQDAIQRLEQTDGPFLEVFKHGSLSVEVYQPNQIDLQQPHEQDEVYIIISGKGTFLNDGVRTSFQTGDFFFVKAGHAHRFEDFTEDFKTWVIFYGPKGGEKA
ncbi:MAG: cupin domain-containing protein [Bacteroidota bacterium]